MGPDTKVGAQLCPTLCDPKGCSPPGCSVRGISQKRILDRVVISYSRRIFLNQGSNLYLRTCISCKGRKILYH